MQEAAKTLKTVGSTTASAATLLLGLYCGPLFAATSVPCDKAADQPRVLEVRALDITTPDLTISVIEHGLTAPTIVVEAKVSEQRLTQRFSAPAMAPRANTILKQIFDESYSAAELDELQPATTSDAKSIAELALPATPNEPAMEGDEAELPALDADLPGVSEDETLRYRRQMFRTDI